MYYFFNAINIFNIFDLFQDVDVTKQEDVDKIMLDLDGTENKSN